MATTLKCLIIDVMNAHDLRLAAWRMGLDAPPSGLAMRGLLLRRTRVTPHLLLPYLSARQVRAVGASVGVRSSGHITLVQTLLEGGASAHAQRVVARRPISRGVSRWIPSTPVWKWDGPARGPEVYLDIETDRFRRVTVLGFSSLETGLVQLVGEEITARRVRKEFPRAGRLFTFNGHQFDLPVLEGHLGFRLAQRLQHCDLRYVCSSCGLRGGQKAIEKRIGFARETDGLDGFAALRLWKLYQDGSSGALETLLRYNADDLSGLERIRHYLRRRRKVL